MSRKKNRKRAEEKGPYIQYTKILLTLAIFLVGATTLTGIYINFKNGCSMDSIVSSSWEGLKYMIPSYLAKSYLETKEEKNMRLRQQEQKQKIQGIGDEK